MPEYDRIGNSQNKYRANIPMRRLEVIGQTLDRKYYYVKKKNEINIKTKFPSSTGNFYVVATDFDRKMVDMIYLYQEKGSSLPDFGAYPPVIRFDQLLIPTQSPCGKPHLIKMSTHEVVGMTLDRRWAMVRKVSISKKKCRYMEGFVKASSINLPKTPLYILNGTD